MASAIAFPVPEQEELAGAGWEEIQEAPCSLSAEISVRGFTIRDLLLLRSGYVVNSKQLTPGRVALRANGSFIAWAEFEVIDGRLNVRMTDLG